MNYTARTLTKLTKPSMTKYKNMFKYALSQMQILNITLVFTLFSYDKCRINLCLHECYLPVQLSRKTSNCLINEQVFHTSSFKLGSVLIEFTPLKNNAMQQNTFKAMHFLRDSPVTTSKTPYPCVMNLNFSTKVKTPS